MTNKNRGPIHHIFCWSGDW